jgi:N-methylhydantoinase A
MSSVRVAVDVGGTFTDIFVFDEISGKSRVFKTPSTPNQPEKAIIEGIEQAKIAGKDISFFAHGTTVGTNALIQRKLPNTALITTLGFKDVPEIRRGTKLDLWDAYNDVAPAYIKRRNRYEIDERIDYSGKVLKEIDEYEVRNLARIFKKKGIESIAICLMNAYVNGENEQKVKDILQSLLPEVYICTSNETLPEIFEHERMSTTIVNAVLGPIVSSYIQKLDTEMREKEYEGDILILHSGGGVMTSETVPRYSGRLASSGIAAGAIASKYIANLCGYQNAIGLDMGGTSTDISLMYEGDLRITKDWSIEYGHPIRFPSIEILTIGAGGGSLAWIDEGGSLRNGPQSAGADPGPACYNLGGDEPTNTDANLVLGRLNTKLIDGSLSLNKELSKQVIERKIAKPFELSIDEAANSILKIANANMCDALQLISVRRGYDPRDFALVAFGGAGALHGAYLAKEMEFQSVIIPPHPGVASAMGCLLVDVRHDVTKTYVKNVEDVQLTELEEQFLDLEKAALKLLEKEGVAKENMNVTRSIDMRYVGQWRTLSIQIPSTISSLEEAIKEFHQEHEREFSFSNPNQGVEIYGLQVAGIGRVPKPNIQKEEASGSLDQALKEHREVYFEECNGRVNVPIYNRGLVPVSSIINGPAILEQLDSTVVIPPDFAAKVDEYKNIILTIEK